MVSIAAAGIFGVGVTALGLSSNIDQPQITRSADTSAALVAALNGSLPTDIATTSETPLDVPIVAAFEIAALNTAPLNAHLNDTAQEELTAGPIQNTPPTDIQPANLTMAMNAVVNDVVAPAVPSARTELPALTQAAFLPVIDEEYRAALINGTVNAFNNVLETVVAITPGDTMMNLLIDIGIDRTEAHYAIEAFGEVFNPRHIRAGQEFNVAYQVLPPEEEGSADDQMRLMNLSMRTAADREVIVQWDEDSEDYVGEARDIELETRFTRGRGTINSSLYMAANGIGVPDAMTVNMIHIFSHSIDFQRDIRDGDSFEVFYSRQHDETGEAVINGDVLFASMTTRGRQQNLYRYTTTDDGLTDYFDEDGKSVRAFLMRTPIDGARITSSFGARRHPVLGYNRMHKGVDFGAPTGTPIYAAGSGTIVRASRFGSYGNYVRIRHANGYETAYAHLNGYGPGIRSGVRVEQGQVIGYVGATGRVTGAHLHYEVLLDDEQVNPRTIELPSGRQLEGDILDAFQLHRMDVDAQMAAAPVLEESVSAANMN